MQDARYATVEDMLNELAESCEYSETEDSSVDSLIEYKDALEGILYELEDRLEKLENEADAVADDDTAKWERLACGQDTEQAEASGVLIGQSAGLRAARELLTGSVEHARSGLDLEMAP